MRWARIISTRIMNSCCKCLEGWTYPSLGESDGERANKFLLAAGQNLCQPRKRHLCGVSSNPLLRVFLWPPTYFYIVVAWGGTEKHEWYLAISGHLLIERHHRVAALISQVWHGQTAPQVTTQTTWHSFGVSVFLRSPLCTEPQATGKWPSCRNAGI